RGGEILKHETAVGGVFVHRRERDRPAAFFQGQLFAAQARVYHGEDTKRWSVVGLSLHNLFLLRASGFKGRARLYLVLRHPRQQSFAKAAVQKNWPFEPAGIVAQHGQSPFGRSCIALSQRARKPAVGGASNSGRSLRKNFINRLVERPNVGFPAEIQ